MARTTSKRAQAAPSAGKKHYKPRAKQPDKLPCGCPWRAGRASKQLDGSYACGCGRRWMPSFAFTDITPPTLQDAAGPTQVVSGVSNHVQSADNAK